MKKCSVFILAAIFSVPAICSTVIDSNNRFCFASNLGWGDWRGDINSGVIVGEYVCSGYVYFANVGWMNLGSGTPTNGIYYQNLSPNDFGVNQDGMGNLRGYAYGANIGWINFENTGAPKVDLVTGNLSGYVYSANCGWISLSNSVAFVQADSIQKGVDSNHDGISDAWELQNFGAIAIDVNADPDHDGMSNLQEYQAGTDPNNASSNLKITAETFTHGGTNAMLTWSSVTTRYYHILKTPNLSPSVWTDSSLGLIAPAGLSTTVFFSDTTAPIRFYHVQAVRPLVP